MTPLRSSRRSSTSTLPLTDSRCSAWTPTPLELGAAVTLECEVTTTSGTYTAEVDVHTVMDFVTSSSSLRNVPIDLPVLLGSKVQASYDWTLTLPVGSAAALNDATTANPWFVPDIPGFYVLTVTDLTPAPDPPVEVEVEIFAAEWVGAISGVDPDGLPLAADCVTTDCHDTVFPEKFTDWANSGHSAIFTNNLNTSGHYGSGCFACHTIGFDPDSTNGGIDETADYADFMAAMFPEDHSHPDPLNWETMLANWPDQAQMANIQCESCHGPNGDEGGHVNSGLELGDARISASSNVCGTCHGEPMRHARFQQWQLSGHGNFEVAIDEGTSGSCAKCHTAQGFLQWFANDLDTGFSTDPVPEGEIQPITCVVCHDPHNVGTASGETNDVTMRVDGDSPPLLGGFTAYGLGHGAMCVVCHNTRRGLANDTAGLPDSGNFDRAPHGGAQGDMMMGENAFFVGIGARGGHSYITDTCSTCHMVITDPPADLSHNLGGTNHTFAADPQICTDCHGAFDPDAIIALNDSRLAQLADDIESAILAEILFHTGAPNNDTVQVSGVDITAASTINSIVLTEYHGRVAMDIDVDGTLVTNVRLSSDTDLLTAGGSLLDNAVAGNNGLVLAKAGWNYFMVHNDGSHGIHNPEFVNDIFVNTTTTIFAAWP